MKEKILKLRQEGKSYNEIKKILKCSKGTISYHCGQGQKEKTQQRQKQRRSSKPLACKLQNFKARKSLKNRTEKFSLKGQQSKSLERANMDFTEKDVLDKFGEQPTCYLTGESINFNEPKSYAFDHIVPASKGGDNSLNNLGLCSRKANNAKSDLSHQEFIDLCKQVLIHHGYKISI